MSIIVIIIIITTTTYVVVILQPATRGQTRWLTLLVIIFNMFPAVCACGCVRACVCACGTDVHAAHRAARGRRIPSCRSWRSWGWTRAAGWSDAPWLRTGHTRPWRCCGPSTSRVFATLLVGSGTTPERKHPKTFRTRPKKNKKKTD